MGVVCARAAGILHKRGSKILTLFVQNTILQFSENLL